MMAQPGMSRPVCSPLLMRALDLHLKRETAREDGEDERQGRRKRMRGDDGVDRAGHDGREEALLAASSRTTSAASSPPLVDPALLERLKAKSGVVAYHVYPVAPPSLERKAQVVEKSPDKSYPVEGLPAEADNGNVQKHSSAEERKSEVNVDSKSGLRVKEIQRESKMEPPLSSIRVAQATQLRNGESDGNLHFRNIDRNPRVYDSTPCVPALTVAKRPHPVSDEVMEHEQRVEETTAVCGRQGQSPPDEDALDMGIPSDNADKQSRIPSLPVSQLKHFRRFDCEVCGKLFHTTRDVKQHCQVVHENRKPFLCEKCGMAFGLKGNLVKHQRNMHASGRTVFPCPTCQRIFSMKGNLTKHIQTVHERIRPFGCDLCSAFFSRRSNLNQHRRLVHKQMTP